MTILHAVAAALATSPPISLSAPFDDIIDVSGGSFTSGGIRTLTMSSGQTITYSLGGLGGTVSYNKNSTGFVAATEGGTLSVANGDTLQHRYAATGVETGSVTLTVSGITVGSFDCIGT